MDLNDFRTDKEAEENGKWFDFGGDGQLKIARFGNKSARKFMNDLPKKTINSLRNGSAKPEDVAKIDREMIAECILVDWKGLTDCGEPLPYSKENAVKILEIPDFKLYVMDVAQRFENFSIEAEKEYRAESEKN